MYTWIINGFFTLLFISTNMMLPTYISPGAWAISGFVDFTCVLLHFSFGTATAEFTFFPVPMIDVCGINIFKLILFEFQ
jgi:hypothetical protein